MDRKEWLKVAACGQRLRDKTINAISNLSEDEWSVLQHVVTANFNIWMDINTFVEDEIIRTKADTAVKAFDKNEKYLSAWDRGDAVPLKWFAENIALVSVQTVKGYIDDGLRFRRTSTKSESNYMIDKNAWTTYKKRLV